MRARYLKTGMSGSTPSKPGLGQIDSGPAFPPRRPPSVLPTHFLITCNAATISRPGVFPGANPGDLMNKKTEKKKLVLAKETVVRLDDEALGKAAGAATSPASQMYGTCGPSYCHPCVSP